MLAGLCELQQVWAAHSRYLIEKTYILMQFGWDWPITYNSSVLLDRTNRKNALAGALSQN